MLRLRHACHLFCVLVSFELGLLSGIELITIFPLFYDKHRRLFLEFVGVVLEIVSRNRVQLFFYDLSISRLNFEP